MPIFVTLIQNKSAFILSKVSYGYFVKGLSLSLSLSVHEVGLDALSYASNTHTGLNNKFDSITDLLSKSFVQKELMSHIDACPK